MRFQNKNIILTGASSGIGKCLLQKLALYEGINIIAVSRKIDNIHKTENIFPFSADLSNEEGVDNVFEFAKTTLGAIDVFIANAGFGYIEELKNADWKHIENISSLNVTSVVYSLLKFNEQAENKERQFVSTCSALAFVPIHAYALYASSKSALHQFMEAYRYEKDENLTLTTIYPVATKTHFFDHASRQEGTPPPFPTQSVETVVKKIISGIEKNKRRVYPSLLFRIFYPMGRACPIFLKIYSVLESRRTKRWLREKI